MMSRETGLMNVLIGLLAFPAVYPLSALFLLYVSTTSIRQSG